MRGLNDGGPTKSSHKTPAVLAELPFEGLNKEIVQANSWIIKQILAKGVHGLILCHANNKGAVKEFVENCRFRFRKQLKDKTLLEGKRGHGGQVLALKIWGISEEEYLEINKSFENLPGQKMSRLFKTGDRTYCFIGIWESEEAIAAQRENMIGNLDKVRHLLEELSPELGVTDPVSGTVVLDYS